ncbi:MAG: chorismate mutase [Arsenophonus sp.]|nr:MAG: chorismate mutase [Arsenophonus sp.]
MNYKTFLFNLRNKINFIDRFLIIFLIKRRFLVSNIAWIKLKNNIPIRDRKYEKHLIQDLVIFGKKLGMNKKYITNIFSIIIEDSIFVQKNIKKKFFYNK